MAALSGLGQQQTAFSTAFGEMKLRKQMQDDALRQMTLDNLLAYLQTSYERRHAEKEQARRQKQALIGKAASIGAAALAGPLVGALGGTAGAAGAAAPAAGAGSLGAAIPQSFGVPMAGGFNLPVIPY